MDVRRRRQTIAPGGAGEDGDFIQLRLIREQVQRTQQKRDSEDSDISLATIKPDVRAKSIKAARANGVDDKEKERLIEALFSAISVRDRAKTESALYTARQSIPIEYIRHPETDETVLHAVLSNDMKEFARFLIDAEHDSFIQDCHTVKHSGLEGRRNALHIATEIGDPSLAGTLLRKVHGKDSKLDFMKQETAVNIEGQRPRLFSCLHLAAYYGNVELVRMFLDEGMSVNHVNGKKDTALLWAARWGHLEAVRLLLDRGADPEVKNDKGSTALYWAIRYQLPDTVKLLLDKGKANPNTTRKLGLVAPIIIASAYGNAKVCKLLLEDKRLQINIKIRGGDTAIHNAAREGHLDIVNLLIAHGALCDEKDEVGDTPLLLAAKHGHVKIVNALLKHNADLKARNNEGFDVWYYAIDNEGMALLKALISGWKNFSGLKRNPLCMAASRGRCDKIHFIIGMNVNADSTDVDGNTFMHHAAIHDQHAVIEEFHSVVSLESRNNSGNTPLHIACLKGFEKSINSLLKCKAKADVPNASGETALHVAAYSPDMSPETAKLIIDYIVKTHDWNSLNIKDYAGNNCLHVAGKFAKPDVLWEFRVVKINERDQDGLTPLHEAVRPGQPDVLNMMLDIFESTKRDASINEQSYLTGETVLHLAAGAGHSACVKRLIHLGADISLQDNDGDTVLHRLVKSCTFDDRNTLQYLEVFDTVMANIVKWWCIKNDMSFPEHEADQTAIAYKQQAMIHISHEIRNNEGLSVLNQAFTSRVPEVLQRLLMQENVTMFGDTECTFDISGLIPRTNNVVKRSCGRGQVAPNDEERKSFIDNNAETQHIDISGLELLISSTAKEHVAEILDLPPIRVIERYYTSMVAWSCVILILIHIVYMSVFTFVGVEVCRKLREDPSSINKSDTVTVLLYVIVPLEPVLVALFTLYRIAKYVITGDIQRKAKLSQRRGVFKFLFLVQEYSFFFVCLAFSALVFAWIGLFTERYTFQDYVLAAALCVGWMLTISFTRGIQAIHYFYRMLLSMILRDVVRFIIVYLFVILAFGFAFHVLFQVSSDTVEAYPTPADTLFLTFNMMIGMGELFDGEYEANMAKVGRDATYAKVIYLFYIILSTIILLNLLIAMMNDSYSTILSENQVTWRIESVSMGVEIEASMPIARKFSNVKLQQGRPNATGSGNMEHDDRWYITMTNSDYDNYMHTFQKRSLDSTDAVSKRLDELTMTIRQTNERLQSLTSTVENIELSSKKRKHKRTHSKAQKDVE